MYVLYEAHAYPPHSCWIVLYAIQNRNLYLLCVYSGKFMSISQNSQNIIMGGRVYKPKANLNTFPKHKHLSNLKSITIHKPNHLSYSNPL